MEILAREDLLVVMEEEESRVQISLWNGRSETWLTDLDISVAGLTHFSFEPVRICLSKNLLAVFVTEPEYRTFFWQLKTSQPTATSPQFLGSVKLTQGEIELNDDEEFDSLKSEILMNENIFAKYFKERVNNLLNNTFIEAEKMLVIAKTELFTADGTLVADKAQFADPDQVGNLWRRMKDIDLVSGESIGERYFYLEPGNSCRMAICSKRSYVFKIVNLATGEDICQIFLRGRGLNPASWWGGNFLFAKDLQRHGIRDDEAKIQVVVFDPRPSTGIRSIKELEEEGLLLPGLGVSCSGVVALPGDIQDDQIGQMVKFDYCGIIFAPIVGDAWI